MKVKRNNWKIHSIGYKLGKSEKIGGGQYDDKGNQIGMWVEQRNEFNQFKYSQYNSWNQSTFKGVYNNQGVKQGRWDIFWNWNGENTKIGGGMYDDCGRKIGNWIEEKDGFHFSNKYLLSGEYINGYKQGTWVENKLQ